MISLLQFVPPFLTSLDNMSILPATRESCRVRWESWISGDPVGPDSQLTSDERDVRNKCSSYFLKSRGGAKQLKKGSSMDADFCTELYYEILSLHSEDGFNLRLASDDSVWRRLTMFVLPDFVQIRWSIKLLKDSQGGQREDGRSHFWDNPQRNWLKSLWWYAHFAHQGDKSRTTKFLSRISNHTDPIQHLVERAGRGGYRVEVNREILSRLGSRDGCSTEELKKIMILNTAMMNLVEPQMHTKGVRGYVDELVSRARKQK
jgi:hypothetical protein